MLLLDSLSFTTSYLVEALPVIKTEYEDYHCRPAVKPGTAAELEKGSLTGKL
jgi:hypothetical protein